MNETPEVFCTHPLRDTEDLCGIVMARVFNPVGVTYKGNGFYTTDHKHVIRSHADVM
jgi:predicted nucleic acid-binding Zn ribbon protein